ncbi:hypothetical protein [Nitratifractor sp.]
MTGLLKYSGMAMLLVAAVGCASKEDRSLYAKLHERQPELKTLQQSEKLILNHGDGNGTIVIANYLPSGKTEQLEKFILALYPQEQLTHDSLRLSGTKPVEIKRLSRRALPATLRRTLPGWFAYYSVTFPYQRVKRMILTVRDAEGVQGSMPFYKGPKYLITRPKF